VRPKKNMKLHHPIIPDRQGPTDGLSPNRHGHRSRSHNDKSDDDDDDDDDDDPKIKYPIANS
jgi:hypothetical protein